MANSPFNPEHQHADVTNKIVVGLERIANAYRVLLWNHAKRSKLSPIQVQLLLFIAYHSSILCTVSHLATEFNLTRPTVSDALKTLEKKGLAHRTSAANDARSHYLQLTPKGQQAVKKAENFSDPIKAPISALQEEEKERLLASIIGLIAQLNQSGVVNVQRTCVLCTYHEKKHSGHYCNLLDQPLEVKALRLDCPEFEGRV